MANNILDKAQLGIHTANKRGKKLEDRVEEYLNDKKIHYTYTPNRGIDFRISTKFGRVYLDCVSTGTAGSIDEKIATKVDKYVRKYELAGGSIHILHPYSGLSKEVKESIHSMERLHDCEVHILDWFEFEELLSDNYIPTPKQTATNGSNWVTPDSAAMRKFFNFEKS